MTAREAVFPSGRQALYERNRYSPAIKSNGFLFVSGQVGSREDGSPEHDLRAQVRLAFNNLNAVLAAAGLKRLGLESRIRATFEPTAMLPAAGQGALGIEVRSDRHDLIDALAPLAHQPTWLTVAAERAVSRAMGGSCSMPLAAHGTFSNDVLQLDAAWGDVQAQAPLVRAAASAVVTTLAQAEALGDAIAQRLRAGGARGADAAHA